MANRIIKRGLQFAVADGGGRVLSLHLTLEAANQALTALGGAAEALFANKFSPSITVADVRWGADARRQARLGNEAPDWAADPWLWANAKREAGQEVLRDGDEFYPMAVAIYRAAGGTIVPMPNEGAVATGGGAGAGTGLFVAAHFMQPVGQGAGDMARARKRWRLKRPEPVTDKEPIAT